MGCYFGFLSEVVVECVDYVCQLVFVVIVNGGLSVRVVEVCVFENCVAGIVGVCKCVL